MTKQQILESKESQLWKLKKLLEIGYPYDYAAILTDNSLSVAYNEKCKNKAPKQGG